MASLLSTLSEELREKLTATQANIVRKTHFPDIPNKIHIAIGMRRTGKTCLMLQTIRHIMQEQQITLDRFLHLNFEDDRLLPCNEEKLARLLDTFYGSMKN